jgi:O-acetyl-ADP-ribose deacetylase (regulator of RNase III)
MKYLRANIKDVFMNFDYVVHGCNCFHKMGTGIAKVLKDLNYGIYEADLNTKRGSKFKLGKYSKFIDENDVTFINAYTQYYYGRERQHLDYEALRDCLNLLKKEYGGKNKKWCMSRIGCNNAGGDWNVVKSIIEETLYDEDVTIIIF